MPAGPDERASRKAKETVAYRRAQRRVGGRVRELRAERKLTLEQLAERADLDLKHLQKVEAGSLNPTLVTFVRLAKGLRVDLAELFLAPKSKHQGRGRKATDAPGSAD